MLFKVKLDKNQIVRHPEALKTKQNAGVLFIFESFRVAHYLNFVQFYLEKASFLAKKWRFNQTGVLIESGVLLPRIRYITLSMVMLSNAKT